MVVMNPPRLAMSIVLMAIMSHTSHSDNLNGLKRFASQIVDEDFAPNRLIEELRSDGLDLNEDTEAVNKAGSAGLGDFSAGMTSPARPSETMTRFKKRLSFWYNSNGKRWTICTPHNMSCNLAPHSCCKGTSCKCNLWGQNCRCHRIGLLNIIWGH